MTMPVIEAQGLSKHYGRQRGVDALSFSVAPGEVFGFLGPNGAGKTTTIRLMLDLIHPSSGALRLFGLDAKRDSVAIRRRLGYLPGELRLYERWSGQETLAYFARLRGLADDAGIRAIAERLDLDLTRPVGELSKGNRQKVGLAQCLIGAPDLLILDEPTSGLDPLVQEGFYALLRERVAAGATVFLSSHVMSEVQRVADRVALIDQGRLIVVDTVEGLRQRAASTVCATLAAPPPADAFLGLAGVRELGRRGAEVSFAVQGEPQALLAALVAYHVVSLEAQEADLESVFLDLYRQRRDSDAGGDGGAGDD